MFEKLAPNKRKALYCFIAAFIIFIVYRFIPFEMPALLDVLFAPLWAVLLAVGMYQLIKKEKPHDPTNV